MANSTAHTLDGSEPALGEVVCSRAGKPPDSAGGTRRCGASGRGRLRDRRALTAAGEIRSLTTRRQAGGLRLTSGTAPPISRRSVTPRLPKTVIVLLRSFSVSDSVSKGAASSRNRLATVMSVPSRSSSASSLSKLDVLPDTPNDARPLPAPSARSTKNPPKLSVARSTVPRSGFNRYRNPLDEVFARSAQPFWTLPHLRSTRPG